MNISRFLKRQSIARNSLYGVSSQILINIISVFVSGYVATSLGDVDYGKFVFAFAFVQIFSSFSNTGIHVVQLREIARGKENMPEFFGATIIFRVFLAILTYGLIVLVISLLDYPIITKQIVCIAGLTLIFTYIADSCDAAFRGYEQIHFSAAINVTVTVFSISLRSLIIYLGFRLLMLSWSMAFISFISALLPYYILKKVFLKPKYILRLKVFREIFILILPFYLMNVFMMAYQRVDILLLSFLKGDAYVGWYNASAMLIWRSKFIAAAICGAIFPVMSRLSTKANSFDEVQKVYQHGLLILFIIALPAAIGVNMLADEVIFLIYDKNFVNSIIVLKIMAFTIPMMYLSLHMQNALFTFSKEKLVTKMIAFYTLVNIVFNLILIPKFGCLGASISMVISQSFNFFLNIYYVRTVLKMRSFNVRFLKIAISGIIMGIAMYLSIATNLFISILIGFLSYFVALLGTRALPPDVIAQVRKMIFQNKNI